MRVSGEPDFSDGGADSSEDELELPATFLPGAFPLTDTGNAERLVALYGNDLRYSPQRRMWLLWNGREWQWDERGLIGRKAKATARAILKEAYAMPTPERRAPIAEHAVKSEKAQALSNMVKLAQTEMGIPVLVDELDADPWVLNCQNGTLDLRTGALRPPRRSDLITKTTGVAYKPGATHELWGRVLGNMTGGDLTMAAYLQRIAGYSLAGVATEKKFFFLHGPPDTGKTSFTLALMIALGGQSSGSYAVSTSFDTWLERPNVGGNREDLVALMGCRAVFSSECPPKKKWDVANIKRVTGGDPIDAAAKYEKRVTFRATCTLIFASNEAPRAAENDAGFWNRANLVPFTHTVPRSERIPNLEERMREPSCAEALLAWAVEGCRVWQLEGVGTCDAVVAATAAYRTDNDWLAAFLELFEIADGWQIPASDFRSHYENFCKQEGQFAQNTKDLAREIETRWHGVRYRSSHGKRFWDGIRLRDTSLQPAQQHLPESPVSEPPAGWTEEPEELELF